MKFHIWSMALSCKLRDKFFGPLDFSLIMGFSHEWKYDLLKNRAHRFYRENAHESPCFIALFIEFIVKHCLVLEDEIINMVAYSIRKYAKEWYHNLYFVLSS